MRDQYPKDIVEAFKRIEEEHLRKSFAVADSTISYSKVCDTVRRLATVFDELGLKQGDSVVYSTKDDMLASVLFIGLLRTGITALFLDAETKPRRAKSLIDLVDPSAMFLDDRLSTAWELDQDDRVIAVGKEDSSLVSRLLRRKATDDSLRGKLSVASPGDLPDSIDPMLTAYVLFTSGTTSDPKGVCISHSALFAHMRTLSQVYGLTPENGILNTLILSHADGIIQGPVLTFFNAATWYHPFKFSVQHVEDLLDTIYREEITHFIAVPTILSLLCRFGREHDDSFQRGFKLVVSCGAQLEAGLWEEFEETFGVTIVNVYGLTETVAGGIFAGPDDASHQIGTIGKPVDCAAKIVTDEDGEVSCGEPGELLISGALVMSGYLKNPVATDAVLQDGWLHTGDVARQDKDGCIRILGRKKSIIISGGVNVHPGEISEVLNTHPKVAEAETYGEVDEIWGERVVSAVSLVNNREIDEIRLMDFCRENLEEEKVPASIHILEELPRGRSGKVRLNALKEMVASQCQSAPTDTKASAQQQIIDLAATCFMVDQSTLSMASSEADMMEWDSLAHLALIAEVEKAFDISMSPAEVIGVKDLADLFELVKHKTGAMQ